MQCLRRWAASQPCQQPSSSVLRTSSRSVVPYRPLPFNTRDTPSAASWTAASAQSTDVATAAAVASPSSAAEAAAQYGWSFDSISAPASGKRIMELQVHEIIRPLAGTRGNDQAKVAALMTSIKEIGLQEPIDVLLVEGKYYGFSGCHRYEAHQRLGLPTILCRVRKANRAVLKMHIM